MSPSSERLIGPRDVKARKPALLADLIYHYVLVYLYWNMTPKLSLKLLAKWLSFLSFFLSFFLRGAGSRKEVIVWVLEYQYFV